VLVAAVLAPHERVHVELGDGRRPAEDVDDLLVLVDLQAEFDGQLGGEFGREIVHRHARGSSRLERGGDAVIVR